MPEVFIGEGELGFGLRQACTAVICRAHLNLSLNTYGTTKRRQHVNKREQPYIYIYNYESCKCMEHGHVHNFYIYNISNYIYTLVVFVLFTNVIVLSSFRSTFVQP